MTAKRFTLKGLVEGVPNICDNGEIIEQEEVVELLNHLHEENKQLKKLNIPIDEIKDTVIDYRGRIIGVYYND